MNINVDGYTLLALALTTLMLRLLARNTYRRNSTAQRTLLTAGLVVLLAVPIAVPAVRSTVPVGLTPTTAATVQPVVNALRTPVPQTLLTLWGIITIAGLLWILVRIQRTRRAVRALSLCQSAELTAQIAIIAPRLGYQANPPELRVGQRIACCSLERAVILVPPALVAAVEREPEVLIAQAALAHELVHLQRRDDQWLLLADCARAWLWWLPGLGYLRARLAQSIEASCDARAGDLFSPRVSYLDGLVGAARIEAIASSITERSMLTSPPSSNATTTTPDSGFGAERWAPALGRLLRATQQDLLHRLDQFRGRLETDSAAPETAGLLTLVLACIATLGALDPIAQARSEPRSTTTILPLSLLANAAAPAANASSLHRLPTTPRVSQEIRSTSHPTATKQLRLQTARRPSPIYPGAALRAEQQGTVVVEFLLSQEGRPLSPQIVSSQPPGIFDDSALRAVQRSHFDARALYSVPAASAAFRSEQRPLRVRQRFRYELIP